MPSDILFEEIQGSGRKQLRDFLRVLTLIFFLSLCLNLFLHKAAINITTTALFSGFVIAATGSLVTYTRLITQIRTDGIYIRFPPFQPSFYRYEWKNIQDIYIRNFNALAEYGGWGIRFSMMMGKGYILPGDTGIQIVFTDKTRLLITTRLPQEMAEVLRQVGRG